jgi:acetyl esterase/lipase
MLPRQVRHSVSLTDVRAMPHEPRTETSEDEAILRRDSPPPPMTVRYGAAPEQVADVWPGDARSPELPLLVLVHGGFWRPAFDRSHVRPMAAALAADGCTVASLEYRRVPGRPDPTITDVITALRVVPDELTRRGTAHGGTVLPVGHSAGGQLVLCATTTPGVIGVVALAPVADLLLGHELELGGGAVQAFLGTRPDARVDLNPERMPTPDVPVVIVHGLQDTVVPIAMSDSYARTHPSVRLLRLPAAGHYQLIDPLATAWSATRRAVLDVVAEAGSRDES